MSVDVSPAAPKKRGRPKRKDPADAPIDGDYTLDQVIGKEKGYEYAYVHEEDLAKLSSRGYVDVERGVDPAKPAFDLGAQAGERTYNVGMNRLRLMKISKERYDAIHAQPRKLAEARMAPIIKAAKQSGGKLTQELET